MRGGKELPSSFALDSPSVISKLATPPHAINPDMSHVINDATSAMHDTYVETDEELETKNLETPIRTSSPRYELPKISEGYVMDEETTRDFLACNNRDDLKKLLCKLKEKSLNARIKYDPKFVSSPIFVDDKDYDSLSIQS